MKKSGWLFLILLVLCMAAFAVKPWPPKHYQFDMNLPDSNRIYLGRVLFYDPILSRDSSVSCESCHSPYTAFAHTDHALSHGIDDRIGTRNAPALFNLAWQRELMWDGAVNHLDMQALAPITHADEMDEKLPVVLNKLRRTERYRKLFLDAWGDTAINTQRLLKSISQFILTLESHNSRYDSMKNGSVRFTEQEQRGYALFRKNCNVCHTEPLLSHYGFEKNGLPPDFKKNDAGRMKVTLLSSDSLKFKVPSLRNIELTYPYMHDGRFNNLSEVIRYYSDEVKPGSASLSLKGPLHLSAEQKTDLLAFLLTLTDRSFVKNKNHQFPMWESQN
jgi:cytochrome c peroxidase